VLVDFHLDEILARRIVGGPDVPLPEADPEELAYGFDGEPRRVLYRVRFRQRDVWPAYDSPSEDFIEVEIYEHWLEPS